MADIQHVVVVLMENRSFDELFGTFPGVHGLNENSPAIPQPFPQSDGSIKQVYPFRMSTNRAWVDRLRVSVTPETENKRRPKRLVLQPGLVG